METWTAARRYRARKRVPRGTNLGGTAEGSVFRPSDWDEGRFFAVPSPHHPILQRSIHT